MEIIRIGYYSSEDVWYNINTFNGFDSYPYPPEDVQIIALVRKNDEWPVEINITRTQAEFLEQLYGLLKK